MGSCPESEMMMLESPRFRWTLPFLCMKSTATISCWNTNLIGYNKRGGGAGGRKKDKDEATPLREDENLTAIDMRELRGSADDCMES
jgi:hypothetical protein